MPRESVSLTATVNTNVVTSSTVRVRKIGTNLVVVSGHFTPIGYGEYTVFTLPVTPAYSTQIILQADVADSPITYGSVKTNGEATVLCMGASAHRFNFCVPIV